MTTRCEARNGSYVCQFRHDGSTRHTGMHYAYYVSLGELCIAEWVDQYGRITTRKSDINLPVPVRRKR